MRPAPVAKLTLYGSSVSGNCLKTRWIAERERIDHDWIEIDIAGGGTKTDDFLAINPAGEAPVARWPDGRILPQSNAIMIYLAEQSGSDLVPADAFTRAQMLSWMFWEQYSHEPYIAVRRRLVRSLGLSDDEIDPNLFARGRRALGFMEMQLTYTDWLVGDRISLADVALVAYTRWAPEGGFDLEEFPSVERWVYRTEGELGLDHALG